MARSKPSWWAAEREFRIRVKFVIPPGGLCVNKASDRMDAWLDARVGRGNYVTGPVDWTACKQASAVYLNDPRAAADFAEWYEANVAPTPAHRKIG